MGQSTVIPVSLENSTFLLDTNFFIDSYSHPEDFANFIEILEKARVALVSINFVKFEFVRSKTIDVVKRKLEYFNKLVETILPVDARTEELVVEVIEEYKQYMEGVPVADLILAASLKKYKGLFILTRDHKDFPTSIFSREYLFNIESKRDIKTYALYNYGPQRKDQEENIPF